MEWKETYSIGVELIDRQHQGLFRAVNRVMDIVNGGDLSRNQRACAEAVKYLKNYTLTHFQDEEAYQREINYADLEAHTASHNAFRQVILDYEAKLQESAYAKDVLLDFMEILTAWLVNHIMKEDQQIGKTGRDHN